MRRGLSQVTTPIAPTWRRCRRTLPRRSIWAEGSAYTIGVANALQAWRPYLPILLPAWC